MVTTGPVPDSPGNFNHILSVKWLGNVERSNLSLSTKNTVGAIMTLFQLGDSARDEFIKLLTGEKAIDRPDTPESEQVEMEDIRTNTIERASEFIQDAILRLDWEQMQQLVAGILRAMGYRTRIAARGADRGADIIASPDGLGLEQPRIRVEVKHREGAVGAPVLRSFTGGLRPNDRGLFVSTGGFSKESRYEAERSQVPVTLLDITELTNLLVDNYDNVDTETKRLIPLRKFYWPA